ncbi:hypothetical protein Pmani_030619 [Petrolisthes manimaculis]|uniref:Uncharacterized protein n=1 Tax=Petrolisthes manimaculis TaxID=1843537 RepID=A0AAE1TTE9_9EUCA|nr:hypothetical protein Pmani_030619 [Petrolisthes manimaculis]
MATKAIRKEIGDPHPPPPPAAAAPTEFDEKLDREGWCALFDTDKIKRLGGKGWTFHRQIKTDGEACSVLFSKIVIMQSHDGEEKKNKKRKKTTAGAGGGGVVSSAAAASPVKKLVVGIDPGSAKFSATGEHHASPYSLLAKMIEKKVRKERFSLVDEWNTSGVAAPTRIKMIKTEKMHFSARIHAFVFLMMLVLGVVLGKREMASKSNGHERNVIEVRYHEAASNTPREDKETPAISMQQEIARNGAPLRRPLKQQKEKVHGQVRVLRPYHYKRRKYPLKKTAPKPVCRQKLRKPAPKPVCRQKLRKPAPKPVCRQKLRKPAPKPVCRQKLRKPAPKPVCPCKAQPKPMPLRKPAPKPTCCPPPQPKPACPLRKPTSLCSKASKPQEQNETRPTPKAPMAQP